MSYEEKLRFNELYNAGVVACVGQDFDAAFELFHEAARINPHSASAAYELARLYQDVAGQDSNRLFHIADSLLLASVRLAPENKYYKIALIENYTKQGRYAESIGVAREVADAYPSTENYLRLENLCEMAEDYAGALYALEHLERLEGQSLENSLYKFWAYKQLGREAEGFKVMEDLCRAFPMELRYRVKMGDLYLAGGHEDIALATYRDVMTLDPDNDAAQYAMLDYYLQQSDSVNFAALLPTFLKNSRAPMAEKGYLMGGYLMDKGMESKAAANLYEKLLFEDKPKDDVVKLCAEFICEADETQLFRPYIDRLLELNPSLEVLRIKALRQAIYDNDDEKILALCRAGRIYNPTNFSYYFVEGNTLAHQQRYEEALDILDDGTQYAAANTPPADIARLYAVRGQILFFLDEPEEAFAAYDSALVYDPNNPETLANYATELTQRGEQLEKALEMSRRAVQSNPDDPFFLGTYAYALACMERYEEARDVMDEALKNAPKNPDLEADEYGHLLDNAGDIYYRLGHTGDAVKFWQQSLSYIKDPDARTVIQQKVRRRRI